METIPIDGAVLAYARTAIYLHGSFLTLGIPNL
jgi:hypothetical protein